MTFVVIEPNHSGHHPTYVQVLVDYITSTGASVELYGTAELFGKLNIDSVSDLIALHEISYLNVLKQRALLSSIGESAHVIIVPTADLVSQLLGLVRWRQPAQLRLLIMRPYTKGLKGLIKRWLINKTRSQDNVSVQEMHGPAFAGSVVDGCPDPFLGNLKTSGSVAIESTTKLKYRIGVLGAVDKRKNVPIVMQALTLLPNKSVELLVRSIADSRLLGELQEQRDYLFQDMHNISVTLSTEKIPDSEWVSTLLSCDLLVCAHSNEGSSGIFTWAAGLGIPVVLSGAESLKKISERLSYGEWVEMTPDAMAAAFLRQLNGTPRQPITLQSGADFARSLIGGSAI